LVPGIGAGGGNLGSRVRRVLGVSEARREVRGGWGIVAGVLGVVMVGVAVWAAGCAGGGKSVGRQAATREMGQEERMKLAMRGNGTVVIERYDLWNMVASADRRVAALALPASGQEDGVWRGERVVGPEGHARMKEVIETVETVVAPETWKDKGGTVGEIKEEAGGILAVTQTRGEQENVKGLIRQMREGRGADVEVEVRVLLVDKKVLDDFGLWSMELKLPGPAKGVTGGILDNDQVKLLLKAIRGRGTSVIVNGPAMTMADGGEMSVRMGGREVAGGFRLAVQATLSADRRYGVLQLRAAAGEGATAVAMEKVSTMVSVPEGKGALVMRLGPVANAKGEMREGLWLMRVSKVDADGRPWEKKGLLEE
jgi:hypothetical protein